MEAKPLLPLGKTLPESKAGWCKHVLGGSISAGGHSMLSSTSQRFHQCE